MAEVYRERLGFRVLSNRKRMFFSIAAILVALIALFALLMRGCGPDLPQITADAGPDVSIVDVNVVAPDVEHAPDVVVPKKTKRRRRKRQKKKTVKVAKSVPEVDVYVASVDSSYLRKLFQRRVKKRRPHINFVRQKPARGKMVTLTIKAKKASTRGALLELDVHCKMSLSKIPGGLIASTKAKASAAMEGGEQSDIPALKKSALPACARELANDFLKQVH